MANYSFDPSIITSLFSGASSSAPAVATAAPVSSGVVGSEYLSMASAGLKSVSALSTSSQQADVSNYNASLLDQQAKTQAVATGSQVSQIRQQGANTLADQAAGAAENGTGTGGSNALLQRQTAIDTEIDASNQNYNGQLKIADLENQAQAQRQTAKAQTPGLLSYLGAASDTVGTGVGTAAALKKDSGNSSLLKAFNYKPWA